MAHIAMPAYTLILIYYALSLFDIWEGALLFFQAAIYIMTLLAAVIMTVATAIGKIKFNHAYMKRRISVVLLAVLIGGIASGGDFLRLSETAFKPRALFQYDMPDITATLTPPTYLEQDSLHKELTLNEDGYEDINPIHEGSILELEVKGTKWAPQVVLSDGQEYSFEEKEEGIFKASINIDLQTSWSLKQGSYVITTLPIIAIDDEAPDIDQFYIEEYENNKGYLAFKVDVDDDRKIMKTELAILDGYGEKSDRQALAINSVKSMNSIYYANFTGSEFSGEKVTIQLMVEDEAGQQTTLNLDDVHIPEKDYNHPVALNLISLREELRAGDYDKNLLARRIKSMGLLGETEGLPAVYYMALRSAYWRLVNPANDNDPDVAVDMLWDIAEKLENDELNNLEQNLLESLDELRLSLRQKKDLAIIREKLKGSDRFFSQYAELLGGFSSDKYDLDIDVKALRKLYSYILAFSDQDKYYNASQIVDFMKKAIVQNDNLIFSRDGLGNYFALTESRQIIDNLIKVQKSLLASSYNRQAAQSIHRSVNKDGDVITENQQESQLVMQQKVGMAVKRLGEKISFAGSSSDLMINNANALIDEILKSMEKSDMSDVAQSQSELIAVMSNLKRFLNKPVSRSPELQNLIKEINSEPVL
ncbi:DUF4175 family protein [Pseudemcibacter aquimaris]|uniref:DUF4175 family protein n=1 Tax=Pseudemcibacter aquimaris TaxID=2857064 RepID=UPI00201385BA|nr:DUF4175 family protein [Pseudemcibacter aquimaris]MCC3861621.1 DUF4175 domain-containing protein [Pseudemcibacter aquimaris]WDU58390.1 DUF4175 domain-containing protein [Pseudemcibacter aquimaris]